MFITVLWIVGAINSVNLIDGADGLAGTTTFIISLALAIIAFRSEHYVEGAIALSLAAAMVSGYLCHHQYLDAFFSIALLFHRPLSSSSAGGA